MTAVNGRQKTRKDEVILGLEELVTAQERLIDWLIEQLLDERREHADDHDVRRGEV